MAPKSLNLSPDVAAKKKSPAKKVKSPSKGKKLAVKADYSGVFVGNEEPATARAGEEEDDGEAYDDPMASYRAAAAAAKVAAIKEQKEEAQHALFKKIFKAMDSDTDGKVEMADMVEKVAAGTAQLSHRAAAARPAGSVALQLPMVFSESEWMKEMKRMSSQMDEATFEANVLGLFACFTAGDDDTPAAPITLGHPKASTPSAAPSAAPHAAASSEAAAAPAAPAAAPLDRPALLKELFDALDTQKSGSIDMEQFLAQVRASVKHLPALP